MQQVQKYSASKSPPPVPKGNPAQLWNPLKLVSGNQMFMCLSGGNSFMVFLILHIFYQLLLLNNYLDVENIYDRHNRPMEFKEITPPSPQIQESKREKNKVKCFYKA